MSAPDFGVHAGNYDGGAWSPFVVGLGIGILSWIVFGFAKTSIGASSFYAILAGLLGRAVARRHTDSLPYYQSNPPRADWTFLFVLFAIAGGFAAAWHGGEFRNEWMHPMWRDRFGDNAAWRGLAALVGGVLMAFGARLAGGCTSGHGISGALQLSVGSWLTVAAMFIGGIVTAMLLYSIPPQ